MGDLECVDVTIKKINKFQAVSIHCRMKAWAHPCVGNKQLGLSTLLKGTSLWKQWHQRWSNPRPWVLWYNALSTEPQTAQWYSPYECLAPLEQPGEIQVGSHIPVRKESKASTDKILSEGLCLNFPMPRLTWPREIVVFLGHWNDRRQVILSVTYSCFCPV